MGRWRKAPELASAVAAASSARAQGAPRSDDPNIINLPVLPPMWQDEGTLRHLLGTDQLGRDRSQPGHFLTDLVC